MRSKLTILLILCNLGAFGYLYWLSQRDVRLQTQFETASRVLLPRTEAINRLEIRAGTETTEIKRVITQSRDGWQLQEPFHWRANANIVDRIFLQLQGLRSEAEIPLDEMERAGQTLADFGLSPAKLTLTYASEGSEAVTLEIGEATALGNRAYAMVAGSDRIHVIDRELVESLAAPLPEYVDRSVLKLPYHSIDTLVINHGKQRILLEKTDENWSFLTPVATAANDALVNTMISQLLSLEAVNFYGPDELSPEIAGLASPRMRVSLGNGDDRLTLAIGNELEAGQVPVDGEGSAPLFAYARLEGTQVPETLFAVPYDAFGFLEQALETLRERQFYVFDPEMITSLTIRQGNQTVTLQRLENREQEAEAAWQIIEKKPDDSVTTWPGDTSIIRDTLRALSELEAERFVSDAASPSDDAQWGFDKPLLSVQRSNGQSESRLLLGTMSDTTPRFLYAKVQDKPFVYGVRPGIISTVQAAALKYRERLLFRHPEAATLPHLMVSTVDGDVLLSLQLDTATPTWKDALTPLEGDQAKAVTTVLNYLKQFNVSNYYAEKFTEPTSFPWKYELSYSVIPPGGDASQAVSKRLLFTERIGGTRQIGGSQADDATFFLEQPLIDALTQLTFEKNPPEPPDQEAALKDGVPATDSGQTP